MSGMKQPGRRTRTPLWQWIVGVPIVAILLVAIALFGYVRYVNPNLGAPVRTVRARIDSRVEKKLPGGELDQNASYLLVHIDGKEVHLAGNAAEWKETSDGDTVEVVVSDP